MKGFLKFIGGFLAVILSIIFFFFIFSFTLINIGSKTLTKKGITDYVAEVDIMNLPIGSILKDGKLADSIRNINDNTTVSEALVGFLVSSNIKEEDAKKIVNNKKISNEINLFLSDSLVYLLYQEKSPDLNANNIISGLEESNIYLTNEMKNEIINGVSEVSQSFTDSLKTDSNEENELTKYTNTIAKINTIPTIVYLLVIIAIFYIFIALFRWKLHAPLMWLSIPTLIAGVLYLTIYLIKTLVFNTMTTQLQLTEYVNLTKALINPLFSKILISSLIMIGTSILSIVVYALINKKINNKDFTKPVDLNIEVKA